MKLHIGVDSKTGLAHSTVVTPANIHDKHPLPELLHGQEEHVWGDCAYAAQKDLIQAKAPGALDLTNKTVRRGSLTEELERMLNRAKSRVRARVEHVFGVVSRTGLAHSAMVTAANVHDKHPLPELLHGEELKVYGDCAYAAQPELIASKAPAALDCTNERVRKVDGVPDEGQRLRNRKKSKVRARVEHVFGVVKRLWGFSKVRYRGLRRA